MKPIFAILFSFLSIGLFAQGQSAKSTTAKPAASNCYEEWYSLIKERGARPVGNGNQDIILSIRSGNYSECFMGKVTVLDGKIAGRPQVQKVDGSYEDWGKEVSQKYFNSDGTRTAESNTLLTISNGMSGEMVLSDGEIVRCFFYQSVLEKTKANKKAPAPSSLVK